MNSLDTINTKAKRRETPVLVSYMQSNIATHITAFNIKLWTSVNYR